MARDKTDGLSPQPVAFSSGSIRMRLPNPEGMAPPLPASVPLQRQLLSPSQAWASPLLESGWLAEYLPEPSSLREGCYLIRYTPLYTLPNTYPGFLHYDGTMRVERDGSNMTISGDLYRHLVLPRMWLSAPSPEPNPSDGIPIFPRAQYRYYVRVTEIVQYLTLSNSLTLGFELHRFNHAENKWINEQACTACMTWSTAPQGYPSTSDYLTGEVRDSSGTVIASLTMGWVSSYLRRAVVEIDTVSQSETPLENGEGLTWKKAFANVGWDVEVKESQKAVPEASGEFWSQGELHQEMLNWRDSAELDTEWRYHLLCVRRIDVASRGIMYDAYAVDSNNIPREGAAISSHWIIPEGKKGKKKSEWGSVAGMRYGKATAPYFRTAVHEIGHAQGLFHNYADNGFMNTTGTIVANAKGQQEFPDNVQWSHASDDQKRLRHMPDVWVRPGGVPFALFNESYNPVPISSDDTLKDAEGLQLEVSPLLDVVPMGAPVRIDFKLRNTADETLLVPASLSLRAGCVRGKVVGPAGVVRTFRPLFLCIDEDELGYLESGRNMVHSLTLLRGVQGALFASPGVHRVIVEVSWHVNGIEMGIAGETSVMITPAVDEEHARAALKVLSTPDALLSLAVVGDHLTEGNNAVSTAMNSQVLRAHYAVVEAKRVGNRFGKRKADFKAACQLIDSKAILSGAEIRRAAEMVQRAGPKAGEVHGRKMVKMLKDRIKHVRAGEEVVKLVKSL